jgi:hypothetical protein
VQVRLCLMLRLGCAMDGDVLRHMLRGHMLLQWSRLPRVLGTACRHMLLLARSLVQGQLRDVGAVVMFRRHRHGHLGPLWHWAEWLDQVGLILDSLCRLCGRNALLHSCLRAWSFLWLHPSCGWDCLQLPRGLRPGRFKTRLGQGRRCRSCRLVRRHLWCGLTFTKALLA